MPYQRLRTPIGKRRDRAIVQVRSSTDDGMGGQGGAPSTLVTIWVAPVPLDERSQEAIMAGQLTARAAYHFDTRYRTDLRPTQQLVWRGKTLQIHSVVDDDAQKRRLILYCSEIQ